MIAMKNASDNAGELIDELQLVYNKARQAAITRNWQKLWVAQRLLADRQPVEFLNEQAAFDRPHSKGNRGLEDE